MHHIVGYLLCSLGTLFISYFYMIYKISDSNNNKIPKGTIVMWNGDISNIPNGWALCDGKNGTLDTRNRFVMGDEKTGIIIDKKLEAGTTISGKHIHPMRKNRGGYVDSVHQADNNKNEKIVYLEIGEDTGHKHSIDSIIKLNPDCITSIFLMKL